jgi:shikimate dehydrogenase
VKIESKNILILGSGGAARAISFNLVRNVKLRELAILDIDKTMLRQLTDDLKNDTDMAIKSELLKDDSLAAAMKNADVIIHCTPVGMHPNKDDSLIPAELFQPGQVVFDIVYTPLETKLLTEARAHGLKVISGDEMFVNQAVLQFEKFTGVDAPVEVMRRVVMEKLKQ